MDSLKYHQSVLFGLSLTHEVRSSEAVCPFRLGGWSGKPILTSFQFLLPRLKMSQKHKWVNFVDGMQIHHLASPPSGRPLTEEMTAESLWFFSTVC